MASVSQTSEDRPAFGPMETLRPVWDSETVPESTVLIATVWPQSLRPQETDQPVFPWQPSALSGTVRLHLKKQ